LFQTLERIWGKLVACLEACFRFRRALEDVMDAVVEGALVLVLVELMVGAFVEDEGLDGGV